MNAEALKELESDLWEAADQLRSNSKLTATQYSMPVLGLIFLRHAYNRFIKVKEEVELAMPFVEGRGRMPVTKKHFKEKKAIFLPEKAQFMALVSLTDADDRGEALNEAMSAIEKEYKKLEGVLPKEYNKFSNEVLGKLLNIFNRKSIANAEGDVFGRIYEFFLNKFAMIGAQEGGEFFTPPSLVNMIVQVIEPNHGKILDPACGSAGMFIQTAHFIEEEGVNPTEAITIIGQEKTEVNTKIGKMNLAVHGLEGTIFEGNTFYEDKHNAVGKCDFVMANPPFNVDGVDKNRDSVKKDPRLPFRLPKNDNANYLWIQYFYAYLKPTGRAGFVMASSTADAGHTEKAIREELVNTGSVDVMMSITNNFFYTRSLPCTLWFLDRAKEQDEVKKEQVLMLDARNVFRKVNTRLNDFTPEQLANLSCVVALYRGNNQRLTKLISRYIQTYINKGKKASEALTSLIEAVNALHQDIEAIIEKDDFKEKVAVKKALSIKAPTKLDLQKSEEAVVLQLTNYTTTLKIIPNTNKQQQQSVQSFEATATAIKALLKPVYQYERALKKQIGEVEKEKELRKNKNWKTLKLSTRWKALQKQREKTIEVLKETLYFYDQCLWLQKRFPEGKYVNVAGLCQLTSRKEIADNNYSLSPERYVKIVEEFDKEFDYESRMGEIKTELDILNKEGFELGKIIQQHLNEMGL